MINAIGSYREELHSFKIEFRGQFWNSAHITWRCSMWKCTYMNQLEVVFCLYQIQYNPCSWAASNIREEEQYEYFKEKYNLTLT